MSTKLAKQLKQINIFPFVSLESLQHNSEIENRMEEIDIRVSKCSESTLCRKLTAR